MIQSNAQFLEAMPPSQEDAMHHRSVSEAGTQGQYNKATPAFTVPYGARTPPPDTQGHHHAEDPPVSSGSLPPEPSGSGRGLRSPGASCSSSVTRDVRLRGLEAQLARKKAQAARDGAGNDEAAAAAAAATAAYLRQSRIDADAAEIVAFEAEVAFEIARSHASSQHPGSERVHAGTPEQEQAEEQRLPIADSWQDRPMIAPQPQQLQTTAAQAGPSAARCDTKGKASYGGGYTFAGVFVVAL